MNVIVRSAQAEDVPAMHGVRLSVGENILSDRSSIAEPSYLPFVQAGSAWVAELDHRIVGFAALDLPGRSVWALFVHPEAEARGVGAALHERMLGWAADRDVKRLHLVTSAGTRAETFYAAAGWRRTGRNQDGELKFEYLCSVASA